MLYAENISRRFFRKTGGANFFFAVKDADFSLSPGVLTEITGRSGSGKTTLLHILAGLLKPTTGNIILNGQDLYAMNDEERARFRNRKIGIAPQKQTALRSLTVWENILLPYMLYQEEKAADQTRAENLMERMGIASLRDAYPNELSGGESRRLSIIRALIREPEILLADEPTGDLDNENTTAVLRLLREIADSGTAVLLVTHEKEAAAYADCHFQMDAGVLTENKK